MVMYYSDMTDIQLNKRNVALTFKIPHQLGINILIDSFVFLSLESLFIVFSFLFCSLYVIYKLYLYVCKIVHFKEDYNPSNSRHSLVIGFCSSMDLERFQQKVYSQMRQR